MRFLKVAAIILAVCGLSVCFLLGYYWFLCAPHFQINRVEISGCNRVTPLEILEMASINRPMNILLLPMEKIDERLSKNPWVDEVKLKRIFPDGLKIEISERKPLAIAYDDIPCYVDRKGVMFKRASYHDRVDYPIITGIKSNQVKDNGNLLRKALDLLDWIDRTGTFDSVQISKIHIDKDMGLTLYTLDHGIQVEMGLEGLREKYERLKKLAALMRKNVEWKNVTWINLNCGKRLYVRKAPI